MSDAILNGMLGGMHKFAMEYLQEWGEDSNSVNTGKMTLSDFMTKWKDKVPNYMSQIKIKSDE
jgi:hypothetical protein